jgi:ribose 5-phosphate isomerase B
VARGETERGIVLGGSGNGEAIASNKVKGVRCALCWTHETAELSRRHNNSNVLSIGERMIPLELALEIVDIWLTTPFDGGRHARRISELDCYEAGGGISGMVAVLERKTTL